MFFLLITLTCDVCGMSFERKQSEAKKSKNHYCSRDCYNKALSKYNFNRRAGNLYPCTICGKEVYATDWKKNQQKYIYCSVECQNKGWTKFFSGINSPNWRKDKAHEERIKERLLGGYKKWRTSVYEKDSYTCQCCGYDKGKKLVAHHKNGWDKYPEQRYDVNNGVTLCKTCHNNFHEIYGFGDNTESQFEKWITVGLQVKKSDKPNLEVGLMIKESRMLAKKEAVKLFLEREKNGLTVNQIAEQTGISRAWIYILAKS